ncbi:MULTISPECIES: hypothetical protein [Clostridium]|uniref:hypothetical protein n=1 Tax=Clostridium TaxID=1485 RepID=UPI00069FAE40|nr:MULTISPECIES: hypothetical protein [Clostridium]KOF56473.1 hypothetical protein AGR56_06715 [Clostridium sp. DMHC 10]MCD2346944.1 hypothetical protein [Clostridium guangxiense]
MDNEVVLIEVFGLNRERECVHENGGSCSGCSGCGSSSSCFGHSDCEGNKNMFLMYKELIEYIKNTDLANKIEIEFIDTDKIDIDKYDYLQEAFKKKFMLPIVAINETVRFYGGVPNKLIYKEVEKELDSSETFNR